MSATDVPRGGVAAWRSWRLGSAPSAALLASVLAVVAATLVQFFVVRPIQIPLEDTIPEVDGRADIASALAWSGETDGTLYVGLQSGKVAAFAPSGVRVALYEPVASRTPIGAVAALYPAGHGGVTPAVVYAPRQLSDEPRALLPGRLGGGADSSTTYVASRALFAAFDDGAALIGRRRAGPSQARVSTSIGIQAVSFPVGKTGGAGLSSAPANVNGEITLLVGVPNAEFAIAGASSGDLYVIWASVLDQQNPQVELVQLPRAHEGAITAIAAAAGPNRPKAIAVAAADGSISIRRVAASGPAKADAANLFTLQQTPRLTGAPGAPAPIVDAMALSADAQTLVAHTRDGEVYAVFLRSDEATSSTSVVNLKLSRMILAGLSPDGHRLVTVDDAAVVRVDEIEPSEPHLKQIAEIRGHGDVTHLMALSPDGKYLATASLDGRVRLTNLELAIRYWRWPLYRVPAAPVPIPMTPTPLK